MLLLFPVEPLSPEGVLSLVARYGNPEAEEAWREKFGGADVDYSDAPNMGLWHYVSNAVRDGFGMIDVIGETTTSSLAPGIRRKIAKPAPSDLDENGYCRCGCGEPSW